MGISPIYNIINKITDNNINILYDKTNSLFDYTIYHMSCNIHNSDNTYYGYYDLAIMNDWQKYATTRLSFLSQHQIADLLFFHNECPANFKKEDKAIFDNSTKSCRKIFLSKSIYDSWSIVGDRSFQINYGIDTKIIDIYKCDHTKKNNRILFLNLNNQPAYNALFKRLSNHYKNIEIITKIDNYESLIQKMCAATSVIDFQSGVNTLYGVLCGAQVITNQVIDRQLISPIYVSDTNHLLDIVSKQNYTHNFDTIVKDKERIMSMYGIDNFMTKLAEIINQMKVEPFIL
jgi:hypothetical protein